MNLTEHSRLEQECCSNSDTYFTETPTGFLLFRDEDDIRISITYESAANMGLQDWMVEGMLRHVLAVTPQTARDIDVEIRSLS
jgi:hypothetical protein